MAAGAAEIVAAIAVGHVSIAVDLEREIVEHFDSAIVTAIRFEPEHRKIGE
jgi:hypothetical protein